MKTETFMSQLRRDVEDICKENDWKFDNEKQRGMAFETWCFNLLNNSYNESENRLDDCVIRTNDFQIDICFPSKEFSEVYFVQSKFKKIAGKDPIDYSEVGAFFSAYEYLSGHKDFDTHKLNSQRVERLFAEFDHYKNEGFSIHFIFITTEGPSDKASEVRNSFEKKYGNESVSFEIWDRYQLTKEFVRLTSIEESYPDEIHFTLGEGKFLEIDGPNNHLTFILPGTEIHKIYNSERQRLFNWNIRSFLGKKGQVNNGLSSTINVTPENFYYLNNGISALCENFDFDRESRRIIVRKLQVVNGAQTVGAIGQSRNSNLSKLQVLMKLTAIKHAQRERGLAAEIIRANNTQNALRVPDFRTNDPIQLWLENKFKNEKPRGELGKIVYGRKRPFPKKVAGEYILKMVDFGKIRYAWEHEPRLPISSPNKLFEHAEYRGVYEKAFGEDNKQVEIWSDKAINEAILAVHCFEFLTRTLSNEEAKTFELTEGNEVPYQQLSRLRFYGLALMKIYADKYLRYLPETKREDLYAIKKKYENFCSKAGKPIMAALKKTYREILRNKEGAAFALPRDNKIWESIKETFNDNMEMMGD